MTRTMGGHAEPSRGEQPAGSSSASSLRPTVHRRSKVSSKAAPKSSRKKGKGDGSIDVELNDAAKYEMRTEIRPLKATKGANKWWARAEKRSNDIKWETLEHNGVFFAPPYEPHGVPVEYDGKCTCELSDSGTGPTLC